MKWKTRFNNRIGDVDYPIYLVEKDIGFGDMMLDLECEYEIYAMAWHTVYTESVADYEKEMRENGTNIHKKS